MPRIGIVANAYRPNIYSIIYLNNLTLDKSGLELMVVLSDVYNRV